MHGVGQIRISSNGIIVSLTENNPQITNLIDILRKEDIKILDISSMKPTLDDVFIQYTGRGLNEVNQEETGTG
jgi:hypothetical protein